MTAATDADSAQPPAPTRVRSRGRASILVSLALLALAALAALVWALSARPERPASALGPRPEVEREEAPAAEGPAARLEIGPAPATQAPRTAPPVEGRPRANPRTRFEGRGVLEGRLRVPPGVDAPRVWSLVLEPSRVLIGGENARARRVEFQGGELEFSLPDVPLGGYEVWAEAEGMSGVHEHLLLARPDATLVYQDLRLLPLAFVEGLVLDAEGVGVPELPMLLQPQGGGTRIETHTDGRGRYVFERVPDGEYLLEAGFADASLCEPRHLAVRSPSLRVPTLEVPLVFELVVRVLDADGAPLAGASVQGWCERGGRIEATTDALGIARQRWIPAGRVQLQARASERPELRHARTPFDFTGRDEAPIELRMLR